MDIHQALSIFYVSFMHTEYRIDTYVIMYYAYNLQVLRIPR